MIVGEMRMICWICGHTRLDIIENGHTRLDVIENDVIREKGRSNISR